jgi:hypothetical protein
MEVWMTLVVIAALFVLPPALVELWWKQRSRREGERLLISPSDRNETTRT